MTFNFNSESDGNFYSTLSSLVKKNNGQFKTAKQAQFLTKMLRRERGDLGDTVRCVKSNYGVDITETQYIVTLGGYMQWAEYGTRGIRPVTWVFVMDDQGVVAQYKLKYIGDMRQGTSPDPSKTQLLWKREGELTPLVFEAPVVAEEKQSQYVGLVGERIELKAKVKAVIEFQKRKFHYYDSSVGYLTKLDVDGNDVIYFGQLGDKGDEFVVKATIKEHGMRDGRKQTMISRPKIL